MIGLEATRPRIVVALDASPPSLAALLAATDLAGRLGWPLIGVFVEDLTVLRAAELPFARQIGVVTGISRALSPADVELQLRVQARHARQALADSAGRARLRWEFRVRRGAVLRELLASAEGAELVSIGSSGWSQRRPPLLGTTARELVLHGPGALLLARHGQRLGGVVLVLDDGGPTAAACAAWAQRIARVPAGALVAGTGPATAARAPRMVGVRHPAAVVTLPVEAASPEVVAVAVARTGAGLVIAPATLLRAPGLLERLAALPCPLLLVR